MITKIISIQFITGILASFIVGSISGSDAFLSTIIGTMIYLIPNTIFAFQITIHKNLFGKPSAIYFFFGEIVKILLILLFIIYISVFYNAIIIWWAFLIGIISVSKIYFYLFLLTFIKNT
ncbi:hypothetical protein CKSOR_00048 [Candidatus Kinetoplastibacterium sorsogonicusi]|uniref:ATP synthase protein I n=1 Tax=Candidatus Kinetoplastidibacterium kentomonadis TaxID=1576550 RepID=A0A3Q8EQZ2_9PROT|nr:ATP synthase subunit I [Candidatus Kinetoplastibacterium sorsogonicusi]AWD32193.1 hypothetical protein CKSOR_00048 [Candidatus Kinetoplastibacterium sorsogonicusi]